MRYKAAPTPYFEFDELREESQQNALTYSPTLNYLARLKKTTVDKITENDVMKHFALNNFRFTKDGRGMKRHVTA